MTRHLEGFMDAVGIERCAVLGSSLGGLLAPLLYAARPETIAVPTLFLSGRQDIRAPIEVIAGAFPVRRSACSRSAITCPR